jgi:hypothetical protein
MINISGVGDFSGAGRAIQKILHTDIGILEICLIFVPLTVIVQMPKRPSQRLYPTPPLLAGEIYPLLSRLVSH